MATQLREHALRCDLLPPHQHGFREAHSCATAIATIVHHIVAARDDGEVAAYASMDVAAAFDTVSHSQLLLKLER